MQFCIGVVKLCPSRIKWPNGLNWQVRRSTQHSMNMHQVRYYGWCYAETFRSWPHWRSEKVELWTLTVPRKAVSWKYRSLPMISLLFQQQPNWRCNLPVKHCQQSWLMAEESGTLVVARFDQAQVAQSRHFEQPDGMLLIKEQLEMWKRLSSALANKSWWGFGITRIKDN